MCRFKDHAIISRITKAWVPEWGRLSCHLSILPVVDLKLIDDLEPQLNIYLDLQKVGASWMGRISIVTQYKTTKQYLQHNKETI